MAAPRPSRLLALPMLGLLLLLLAAAAPKASAQENGELTPEQLKVLLASPCFPKTRALMLGPCASVQTADSACPPECQADIAQTTANDPKVAGCLAAFYTGGLMPERHPFMYACMESIPPVDKIPDLLAPSAAPQRFASLLPAMLALVLALLALVA